MGESVKSEKVLTNENKYVNNCKIQSENETIRMLEALSQKMRSEIEEEKCDLIDTCYISKTRMGSCPCELFR